jgi:hypothetical protein
MAAWAMLRAMKRNEGGDSIATRTRKLRTGSCQALGGFALNVNLQVEW